MHQLNTFREDMEAKFALQATENKRLQEHITNLTEENRSIERRVVALEKSNKRLTEEVFGK
jgi:septal ring factor EnvC (AmiA/AmiB activator)